MTSSDSPFVTVVMPALNEERYIAAAIASLLPDEGAPFDCEILVADGGSSDATVKIVRMLGRGDRRIRVIPNGKRLQAAGVNQAAQMADPRSTVLVRADCHAAYPPAFVARCLDALKQTGAASVVVPMRTRGLTCMQRAVAAAQNSRLGNGGSAHRLPGQASRFVDHGHHAAFDRQVFLDLGGYDESFSINEDAEYDRRLTASGRRIWLADEAAITYFPRADLVSLARQYAAYGAGRARTVVKLSAPLKPRQMLPVVAFVGCALSALAAVADLRALVVAAAYAALCIGWGMAMAMRRAAPCLVMAGVAAITMHLAWGYGFLRERARLAGRGVAAAPRGAIAAKSGRD